MDELLVPQIYSYMRRSGFIENEKNQVPGFCVFYPHPFTAGILLSRRMRELNTIDLVDISCITGTVKTARRITAELIPHTYIFFRGSDYAVSR